ncbi:MAG: acyltransferase [Pseudomonadota bacterium]
MTDATHTEMPRGGMLTKARWAAENTPASRNRAVDLYRAIAILFVVFGHWLLVAPVVRGGELEMSILLAEQPWTQYATWLFQVMPVFFFVGGFSNSLSWESARKDPEKKRVWAATRLTRLLKPTVPLVLLWAALAFIAKAVGVDNETIKDISQAALVPIWLLAVYIVITVVVPLTVALWDRIGFASVLVFAGGAIAVDAIAFGMDQQWLRWSNYGFVWLAVHQLGYWWRRTERPKTWALGFIALGLAWLYVLIAHLGFPVSMVSVPGEEISNTRPPTTAMLAVGCVQIGVILLISEAAQRWLQNPRPWSWVIVMNQMIMSVYLWHMTAMIAVIGLAMALGGFGLSMEPGTGVWWSFRPLWLALFGAMLVPFLAIFLRFESGGKGGTDTQPGPWQAVPGALVTCGGLIMMALAGVGADTALGINWVSIVMVLAGVMLGTIRLGGARPT